MGFALFSSTSVHRPTIIRDVVIVVPGNELSGRSAEKNGSTAVPIDN